MSSLNPRTKKWALWGLGIAGLAVAAPALVLAVKGLISLVIAVTVGSVAMAAAPVVSAFLANMKLKGIKLIAARNPVEQLQNALIERQDALKKFAQRITEFATQVRQFDDKMAIFAAKYPQEAPKFKSQSDAMHRLLTLRRERYNEVKGQVELFEEEVKKADAIWQMSQAAAELNKAAGMESEDVFAKIKAETAVESIQLSLNRSFAELELALMEEGQAKPAAPSASPLAPAQPALAQNPQPVMLQGTTTSGRVRPLSKRA